MNEDDKIIKLTDNDPFTKKHYTSDDYSRFAAPDYLDRISLSHATQGSHLPGKGILPLFEKRADPLIYEDARVALLNDSFIDACDIFIEVHEGIVTLTGYVESREMKKNSEVCIEHIQGIVDIFNLLKIYQFKEAGPYGLVKTQSNA